MNLGSAVSPPDAATGAFAFPCHREKIAGLTEAELRACKMGFRAPHLLAAARQIADGRLEFGPVAPITAWRRHAPN